MKKAFSLLALVVLIASSNCTQIPENNDPILGIWARTEILSDSQKIENQNFEEWIFNDAFLGRYHNYNNGELEFFTDFSWSMENEIYTISYPGTNIPDVRLHLETSLIPEQLTFEDGAVFAIRE